MPWRERLAEAVRRSGRKQRAIAADAGIAPETLSNILRGRQRHASFNIIARIAYATGVSVGWLLEEDGFDLSPLALPEIEQAITFLRVAIDRADTAELLRLRTFLDGSTLLAPHSPERTDAEDGYTWRSMIVRLRRDEYRARVAALRPLLAVFRNGRLEVAAAGGADAMLYVRTAPDKQFYIGGAHTNAAHAITAALNLLLDLYAPEPSDDRSASERGTATTI